MRLAGYLAILPFLFSSAVALAAKQHPSDAEHQSGRTIDVTSYITGSYNYLQRSKYFTSGIPDRVNDIAENGVRLQQLFLSVSSLPENGFGAYTEMAAGLDAYSIAPNGWNANMFNLQNIGFAVPDAYLYYGYRGYTLEVGLMEALAGFESFNYLDDTIFSRGLIYGYVAPGVHMSVRNTSQMNDAAKVIFGIVNGWATIRQPGNFNAAEMGVDYKFTEKLSAVIDAYLGRQYLSDNAFSGPAGRISLLDFYGTYQYTEALSFNWNLDYAIQPKAALPNNVTGRAAWSGVGGYVNYQLNDKWRSTVRGEIMNDSDGFRTGVRQNWKEVTLTFGYEPIRHLSVIAEARHDFSNVNAFVNKNGVNSNNNQQSYALEALYQFV